MWMTFIWQGQEMILKGNDSISVETIRIKQLNGSLNKTRLVPEINLCNLRFIVDEGQEVQLMSTILRPCINENAAFEALKVGYHEVFEVMVLIYKSLIDLLKKKTIAYMQSQKLALKYYDPYKVWQKLVS